MRSVCAQCGGGISSIIISGRLTRARRASGAELGDAGPQQRRGR